MCVGCFVFHLCLDFTDIDECEIGADDCDSMNAECNNTIGSYECYCRGGYRFNGTYCESTYTNLHMKGNIIDCLLSRH